MRPSKPARRLVTVNELQRRAPFVRVSFAECVERWHPLELPPDPELVTEDEQDGWILTRRVSHAH
jgi:hypothetical protein